MLSWDLQKYIGWYHLWLFPSEMESKCLIYSETVTSKVKTLILGCSVWGKFYHWVSGQGTLTF